MRIMASESTPKACSNSGSLWEIRSSKSPSMQRLCPMPYGERSTASAQVQAVIFQSANNRESPAAKAFIVDASKSRKSNARAFEILLHLRISGNVGEAEDQLFGVRMKFSPDPLDLGQQIVHG